MPFNVWCSGCDHLIGKGVRFNAEKKHVGNYHSTKIWSFAMRSPCCQTRIEVRTDPKKAEYVVVEGGRRKKETYDAAAAGTLELEDPVNSSNLHEDDPFLKLEKKERDRRMATAQRQQLTAMYDHNEARHKDTYAANKALRARMRYALGCARGVLMCAMYTLVIRVQRKEDQALTARRDTLGLPSNVQLLPESEMDRAIASTVAFARKTKPPPRAASGGAFAGIFAGSGGVGKPATGRTASKPARSNADRAAALQRRHRA